LAPKEATVKHFSTLKRSFSLAVLSAAAAVLAGCAVPPPRYAPPPSSRRVAVARPVRIAPRPAPVTAVNLPLPEVRIALLVPESGPLGGAGQSVRDGFLTAYYQMPPHERPRLRIYNTAGVFSIPELIARATDAGANFIVGPLIRSNVEAAAADDQSRPAMLALNFLPHGMAAPPRFYQFALSPTAEARMVARRVLADGHRIGIAIVPKGTWGTRVLDAFRRQLEAGGGRLLAVARINLKHNDYAGPITRVLLINQSEARRRDLQWLLGMRLGFVPRRRQDIQFIFAPAPAHVERQLEPELRFFYANNVPTYSTSDAFAPNPVANQNLDGLRFLDMPWLLGGPLPDAVRATAERAWPYGGPDLGRLFAFGFDAYHLTVALVKGQIGPHGSIDPNGLTGRLRLGPGGHIHRGLLWAQLRNGEIRILPAR
jgi:outer membrane PBP1 activator LpoA protein